MKGNTRIHDGSESIARMERTLGTVTIHPSVVATVARLTALAIPGVVRLGGGQRYGVGRMLPSSTMGRGVDVSFSDGAITVGLYVVAEAQISLMELGRRLQSEVSRAIRDLIGMEVRAVNIYIQDVETTPM